jgi:hypothetical protein
MTELDSPAVPPVPSPAGPPPAVPAGPPPGNAPSPAVVDGVDLDAVAAAARGCPAIDDLSPGAWGGVVSYLPGRQVAGVRIASDHVVISVRGRWGVPAAEMARQVRTAVGALVAPRRIDLVVADLAGAPGDPAGTPGEAQAGGQHEEAGSWTTSSPGGGPAASSSAPTTPTGAATRTHSPLDSPPMTGASRVPRLPR